MEAWHSPWHGALRLAGQSLNFGLAALPQLLGVRCRRLVRPTEQGMEATCMMSHACELRTQGAPDAANLV